jgi:hypothetical protein
MDELLERLRAEMRMPANEHVCGGTLLSREQYGIDIGQWGYRDARLAPLGNMTAADIAHWTAAISQR